MFSHQTSFYDTDASIPEQSRQQAPPSQTIIPVTLKLYKENITFDQDEVSFKLGDKRIHEIKSISRISNVMTDDINQSKFSFRICDGTESAQAVYYHKGKQQNPLLNPEDDYFTLILMPKMYNRKIHLMCSYIEKLTNYNNISLFFAQVICNHKDMINQKRQQEPDLIIKINTSALNVPAQRGGMIITKKQFNL